ncbi:MAG: Gfo/Idh/MocA family oxidoreductase [Bifidobacteriaceae bacterium]|nr:Gfo/Idh/MocA family oxidoreductase [Bifidobacteriaceae bacterium]
MAKRSRPRVAIFGGGMIAEVHRRSALLAGAEIVGVLDQSPAASAKLAARWNVAKAYADAAQAISDGIDVLHICTPNATHAEYARMALEAGLNVICEKPLAVTAREASELAELAAASGVVAAVPFIYRFHPLVREIRARRVAGDFGQWWLLHGSYLQDWLASPAASSWRVDPVAGGPSRAFADIGSHWCDLVEWVSGERIAELVADTATAIPRRQPASGPTFSNGTAASPEAPDAPDAMVEVKTEDIVTVGFRTGAGTPGSLTVSQVSAGRKNRLWFELDGQNGSAVFDQENPETVWLGGEDESRLLVRDPGHGAPDARRVTTLPAGHVQGWAACFETFITDVYASLDGELTDGVPTFADGARAVRIVEAVLDSAKARRWVRVADPELEGA